MINKQYGQIFIVDDDEQQITLMQEMAKAAQLRANCYTESTDFLNANICDGDIIVLDLQMPGKDGIEIMRELAEQGVKPNFILISGFDDRVLHSAKKLAESKQLTVIATLTKPVKAKNFINLLKHSVKTYPQYPLSSLSATSDQLISPNILLADLKLAIRRHQLVVYFQPRVCFKSGNLMGIEALVRWQHDQYGLILPELFIPLAETHQLMNLLTEEVFKITLDAYKKILNQGICTKISVNLSAQNISDLSMPEKLTALIKDHQMSPESFILEMTESVLMDETISDSLDILNRLRMKGFGLSLDDFGSGCSSLVKLYQAPFTELKIDQRFVKHIITDDDAAAIVRMCILLAKELKLKIIAEGVETEEIWQQLKQVGCDIAQGHFVAKAMPLNGFINWLENRKFHPSLYTAI